MKVAIVYGNQHKGSTYHCVEIFKNNISQKESTEFIEFFLPKNMPYFCVGCFNCIYKGEENCPHAESMKPIIDAFDMADGIVLASPNYVMNVSGAMKSFLDHMAFRWLPHRPHAGTFDKIGAAIATTAGMGAGKVVRYMRQNLDYWGVKRIYTSQIAVMAKSWEEVSPKNKVKAGKRMAKLADRFYKAYVKRGKTKARLKTRILFSLMRGMQKNNDYNPTDRAHWKKNGWLEGVKPF